MRKRALFCLAVLGVLAASDPIARAKDEADTQARCMAAIEAGRKVVLYANGVDPANGMPVSWGPQPPIDDRIHGSMTVYFQNGRIGAARRFDASLSADWLKTQDYCFRSDGTLAFIKAELRTLRGGVRVEDRMAFDAKGMQIRAVRIVRDLETDQDVANLHVKFKDQKTVVYRSTRALRDALGDALE